MRTPNGNRLFFSNVSVSGILFRVHLNMSGEQLTLFHKSDCNRGRGGSIAFGGRICRFCNRSTVSMPMPKALFTCCRNGCCCWWLFGCCRCCCCCGCGGYWLLAMDTDWATGLFPIIFGGKELLICCWPGCWWLFCWGGCWCWCCCCCCWYWLFTMGPWVTGWLPITGGGGKVLLTCCCTGCCCWWWWWWLFGCCRCCCCCGCGGYRLLAMGKGWATGLFPIILGGKELLICCCPGCWLLFCGGGGSCCAGRCGWWYWLLATGAGATGRFPITGGRGKVLLTCCCTGGCCCCWNIIGGPKLGLFGGRMLLTCCWWLLCGCCGRCGCPATGTGGPNGGLILGGIPPGIEGGGGPLILVVGGIALWLSLTHTLRAADAAGHTWSLHCRRI